MKKIMLFAVSASLAVSMSACGTGSPSAPLYSSPDSVSESSLVPSEPLPTEDPRDLLTREILDQKLQHFVYTEDEFDHTRYYASKYDHKYDSSGRVVSTEVDGFFDPVQVYISVKDLNPELIVRFVYYGDDWIFFDTVDFNIDNNIYTIDLSSVSPNTKVLETGTVSETYSVYPGADLLDVFGRFDSFTSTKIRFRGEGSYTFPLSSKKKQGIIEALTVYNDLVDNYRFE